MIVASWHGIMGNGTWNMGIAVLGCERCIVPIHLHFPLPLLLQDPFLSLCALFLRLDLEYTCTLNRVTFIPSMSNCWEQELQQCLEADVDFDVGDFIARHPQIAPPTIRRRHASMRQTLMKRLNKRAKRGVQSSWMASLNTAQAQAAKGCIGGRGNTPQAQAAKGSRNTSAAQAAKGSTRGTRNTPQAQAAKSLRNTSQAQAAKGTRNTPESQRDKGIVGGQLIHRRSNMPKLHILDRQGSLVPLRKSFSAGSTRRHLTFL